jgi:hypothetical protein
MAGMGVAACDYNHSGRFSIVVTNFEDQGESLYRNDGRMEFSEVATAAGIRTPSLRYLGWGVGCVDLDNDGWSDLLIVNGHVYPQVDALKAGAKYRERKLVFQNQRDGNFRDVSAAAGDAIAVPEASRGAAFGDLDNDGKIDVVIENIDGSPTILHNDSAGTNHWVTLQLIGTRSNRMAIGAKVKVIAGSLVQIDEVRSGGSYLSQNDVRVHFGLENAGTIDRIEIRWPSGQSEVLQNMPVDRFYVVKEGEGIVPNARSVPGENKGAEARVKPGK